MPALRPNARRAFQSLRKAQIAIVVLVLVRRALGSQTEAVIPLQPAAKMATIQLFLTEGLHPLLAVLGGANRPVRLRAAWVSLSRLFTQPALLCLLVLLEGLARLIDMVGHTVAFFALLRLAAIALEPIAHIMQELLSNQ